MGWLRRLLRRRSSESGLLPVVDESVTMRGVVQALDTLRSPISGEECVSIRLFASVPAAFGTLLGAVARHEASCHQGVEFLLRDGQGGILVKFDPGADVTRFHAELVARHGLDLECLEELVCDGDVVSVSGQVVEAVHGTPHRRAPYRLVVAARKVAPVT